MQTKIININIINQTYQSKSWCFEEMSEIDQSLAKVAKMKRKKTQINKSQGERKRVLSIPIKSRESLGNTLKTYIPKTEKSRRKG